MVNEIIERLNFVSCRANKNKLYVFGDNLLGKGRAGQAEIRGEPNAFGIPTKVYPSMKNGSFMSDCPEHEEAVKTRLRELYKLQESYVIVFPSQGLGTGLAKLEEHAPKIFKMMNEIIVNHFGIDEYKKIYSIRNNQ